MYTGMARLLVKKSKESPVQDCDSKMGKGDKTGDGGVFDGGKSKETRVIKTKRKKAGPGMAGVKLRAVRWEDRSGMGALKRRQGIGKEREKGAYDEKELASGQKTKKTSEGESSGREPVQNSQEKNAQTQGRGPAHTG